MQQQGLDLRATKRHFVPPLLQPHMTPSSPSRQHDDAGAGATHLEQGRGVGGFRRFAGVRARAEVDVFRLRVVVLSSLSLLCACGQTNPPMPDCRVGADCASGVCTGEGKCAAVVDAGHAGGSAGGATSGGSAGGAAQAGGSASAGGAAGGTSAGGSAGSCLPNHDGTITRAEVITAAGLRATFKVSTETPFDTSGVGLPDGGRFWDFTQPLTGDMNTLVETQPIVGQWFESKYPDAGYVVPLGQGSDLLAVFASNTDGLYLLGTASPSDGTFATALVYSPPVKMLKFPMQANDTWTTTSAVLGKVNGVSMVSIPGILGYTTDTYTSTVDRTGDVLTPYASQRFPVLRVRTVMERAVTFNQLANTSFRQFQFVTECFGTVATVRSKDAETSTEFLTAKEVRRLAP
jgi:hypothetical protein